MSRKSAGVVLFTLEHAPELKLREPARQVGQFLVDVVQGFRVVLSGGQVGEIGQVRKCCAQVFEPVNHGLQRRLFPPQGLGPVRLVPEFGIGEFALDLL